MPKQDGTGPQGNGPRSGKRFRKCKTNADPNSDLKKRTGQCQRRLRVGSKISSHSDSKMSRHFGTFANGLCEVIF